MNRRYRRAVAVALATLAVVSVLTRAHPALAQEAIAGAAAWPARARIAGAELFAKMTDREIMQNLSTLADQNVSVIEADSDLSRLLTEREFEGQLALMRRYCEKAHQLGMRVVWYYPTLEVLSPNATRGKPSMAGMHPSWLQRGLDGTPNVFIGSKARDAGDRRVHWVDAGTESAWMSLHSPYTEMFLDHIKKIAATGVDGIWLDVPIYNDIGTEWADTSPGAAAKFRADTRMEMPKSEDWENPAWRRWIAWRHREISSFIFRVRDAARSIAGDITIVVEIVTLDYNAATKLGLDGSTMKTAPGVIAVWEVDAVSDATAMREAGPDDWVSLIGMSKFAKAASGKKPSWMFTYGKEPDDGLLVMAEALAAGNNPYETRIPEMTTTIGTAYRKRVFSWIKQEERRLFDSASAARIAVYYSPESRDYVDKADGLGLFATTKSGDDLWWSLDAEHSIYSLTYMGEYRGIIKWLANNHYPFDIVVRPDAAELSRYETVIAPSLQAIGNRDAQLLDQYVAKGGNLVVTGRNPTALDEFGNPRGAPALKSLVRRKGTSSSRGSAKAVHSEELVGKAYLLSGSRAASDAIGQLIGKHSRPPIETNAGKSVHIELRALGNELLLHLINPERLWNREAPKKQEISISLEIPLGTTVGDVQVTSPQPLEAELPNEKGADDSARSSERGRSPSAGQGTPPEAAAETAARSEQLEPKVSETERGGGTAARLAFTVEGHRVSFKVPLEAYEMVVVSTKAR
jgi:Beta-galactosidase trimerisation domain